MRTDETLINLALQSLMAENSILILALRFFSVNELRVLR